MEMEKKSFLAGLSVGDAVQLTDGRTAELVRVNRTRFVGMLNGEEYNIPISFVALPGERGRTDSDFEKRLIIDRLNNGDEILLTNGWVGKFVGMKRTKFTCLVDGKAYSVPVSMFEKVIEQVNVSEKRTQAKNDCENMKKGDLFYIVKGKDALLYAFEGMAGNVIIGKSIVTNNRSSFPADLFGGRLKKSNKLKQYGRVK